MADRPIGKVTHYYDKIGVAVVKVSKLLSVGDSVKIVGHGNEHTQIIESMQKEHESIQKAKTGMEIGVKVNQPVKEGDQLFLIKT